MEEISEKVQESNEIRGMMDAAGKRRKGRPKRRWMDDIRQDLTEKGLSREESQDWAAWSLLI